MASKLIYPATMSVLIYIYRNYCPILIAYITNDTDVECRATCALWAPMMRNWVDSFFPGIMSLCTPFYSPFLLITNIVNRPISMGRGDVSNDAGSFPALLSQKASVCGCHQTSSSL
jgi:hypothetical protein